LNLFRKADTLRISSGDEASAAGSSPPLSTKSDVDEIGPASVETESRKVLDRPSNRSSLVSVDRLRLREAMEAGIGGGGFFLISLSVGEASRIVEWLGPSCETGVGDGEGACSVIFGTSNGSGVLGRLGGVEIGAGEEDMILSAELVTGRPVVEGFECLKGMGCAGLLWVDAVTSAFSNLDRREDIDPMDWTSTRSDEESSFLPSVILGVDST